MSPAVRNRWNHLESGVGEGRGVLRERRGMRWLQLVQLLKNTLENLDQQMQLPIVEDI